ncbi:MAG TPA: hypothetical protein VM370_05820 [Candidatus Thermoplasmatota archaeon]|nr:hypothetical protein [Candidatus Thermoplasmatota archaeon]
MRSHPVVGSFFLLLGTGLLAAGAFGNWSPAHIPGPLPASVVIPFFLWQLAVWAILFGVFFLRARGKAPKQQPRFAL